MKTFLLKLIKNKKFVIIIFTIFLIAIIMNLLFGDFYNLLKIYITIVCLLTIFSETLTTKQKSIYWIYGFLAIINIALIIANFVIEYNIGLIKLN